MFGWLKKRIAQKKLKKEENKEIVKTLLDYVEGRISADCFWKMYLQDDKIKDYLCNTKSKNTKWRKDTSFDGHPVLLREKPEERYPINLFNLRETIDIGDLRSRCELFYVIHRFLKTQGYEFKAENEDCARVSFFDNLLPARASAPYEFVEQVYNSAPPELNKTEKKKWCKQNLQEMFAYDKNAPSWIQPPEWPIVDGVPYVFSHQESPDDGPELYYFYDPHDKKKVIVVEQCE